LVKVGAEDVRSDRGRVELYRSNNLAVAFGGVWTFLLIENFKNIENGASKFTALTSSELQ
jgi:hypothetical protein